jgi:hypothetical protein
MHVYIHTHIHLDWNFLSHTYIQKRSDDVYMHKQRFMHMYAYVCCVSMCVYLHLYVCVCMYISLCVWR